MAHTVATDERFRYNGIPAHSRLYARLAKHKQAMLSTPQDAELSIVAKAYESADDWQIVAFFGRLHAV